MSDFNTVMVNKVINVIRYTLIQYREENNDLIRTVRQIAGENLMYNDLALTYTENNDYLLYNVLEKWVTASGQDLPLNVPDTFTTYYAKRMTVKMPNTIEIIKNNNTIVDYTTSDLITIISNSNVYLKNEAMADFTLKYTVVRSNENGKIKTVIYTSINSVLTDLVETININPTLKLYRDVQCNELITQIPMNIIIDSSSSPTGD